VSRPRLAAAALVALALALCVLPTAAHATLRSRSAPILSPRTDVSYPPSSAARGFGQVRPREIYYGGDPTGLVCDIHWHSWGGRVARGTAVGYYIRSNQSVNEGHFALAHVIASKLGTWNGRPAYTRLTWSFPDHGADRAASPACLSDR
jgi:hypothetical protein